MGCCESKPRQEPPKVSAVEVKPESEQKTAEKDEEEKKADIK